jgi:hypothetical protein
MKKLLMAAGLCALFATPGLAGEPVKLSLAQMDMLTAGFSIRIRDVNVNVAVVDQTNLNFSKYSWVSQTNAAAVSQNIDD